MLYIDKIHKIFYSENEKYTQFALRILKDIVKKWKKIYITLILYTIFSAILYMHMSIFILFINIILTLTSSYSLFRSRV